MIQTYFWPVLGHFMPIDSGRLYNDVELILFPNFRSHFSKGNFVGAVVMKRYCMCRKLNAKV